MHVLSRKYFSNIIRQHHSIVKIRPALIPLSSIAIDAGLRMDIYAALASIVSWENFRIMQQQ